MRRLVDSGAVPGHRFVQIGLRGYWPPPHVVQWMREQRMRSWSMEECTNRGLASVVDDAVAWSTAGDVAGVFVSVDIDVVDPGAAPGTGTPEPGGLQPCELLDTVRRLGRESALLEVEALLDEVQALGGIGFRVDLLLNLVGGLRGAPGHAPHVRHRCGAPDVPAGLHRPVPGR
jgi:hypothetical protein